MTEIHDVEKFLDDLVRAYKDVEELRDRDIAAYAFRGLAQMALIKQDYLKRQ